MSIEIRPIDRRRIARGTTRPPVGRGDHRPRVERQRAPRVYDTRDAGAAPRQRRSRDVDVVERQHPVADHLVLLVPLAGDQHEVARLAPR